MFSARRFDLHVLLVLFFPRTNYSIRRRSGVSPKLRERQSENPSIRKVLPGIFVGYALIARDVEEELEELDASEIYPRRLNAKEVMISNEKTENSYFSVADGSAKLSGRSYEFQESTLRRLSTVRRENLSGESHDDREEFRPEETKDDARIHKDFWSIQGDFHLSSSC